MLSWLDEVCDLLLFGFRRVQCGGPPVLDESGQGLVVTVREGCVEPVEDVPELSFLEVGVERGYEVGLVRQLRS